MARERTKLCKKLVEDDAVQFVFNDGKTPLTAKLDELSEEMKRRLALHGIAQKVGDSYNTAESVAAARAAAEETWKALKEGVWARKGGGQQGKLMEALARVTGLPIEQAIARWEKKTEDEKAALRKHPQVVQAIREIEAERAAAAAEKAPKVEL